MEAINIMQDTNNLDIEDYMDVVTTYKCRFCSFTSSAPEGISEHVKQIHIQQPIKPKTETIQINNRKIPINSLHVLIQTLASASHQSHDSVTLVTVDQLDEQVANFTGDDNTESSTFNIISIGNQTIENEEKVDTCLVENLSETNGDVNCDGSTQTNDNNQTDFTLEVQSYESANSPKSTPPITKELFLCGQCSIGYNSIEDCKSHMVEDHNIQIEDPTVGNIKISVGTQVENTGKKPGRKKKSETVPAAENETITIQPLSDSDWEEDKDDYYIGSRSRRKIRRPKALKDDYYLPKRKHIDIDKEKKSYTHLPKTMKMQPVTDKCEVCSFATGHHNSLRRHSMRHTGQRPYRCNYCPYTCIQAISIKMHMKNKHPNAAGVFCCNECTYRTVNEQFFLNHIKDHENGLIQEKEHISNTIHDQSTMQIMNENGIQLQDIIEIQQKSAELDQDRTPLNLQMQVQTLESGETQISADDFAKISSYEDLGSSNISSSQLNTVLFCSECQS
ncbi:unnamed protein product [Mytilus edulis]|uniref:C2H2-type domain-containing protein n=1 Tax=Mytilus edulis TaxID=6550 RepID=A0A8S3RSV0_MYTED|nr:unnamed protein product [Mytilus edulis]